MANLIGIIYYDKIAREGLSYQYKLVGAGSNFELAIEEFAESLLAIKSEDANISVFRSLQIIMSGRKRRIGDLGNVESPDDPMKIQLMMF